MRKPNMKKVVFKIGNRIGNGTQRKRLYKTIRDKTFGFGCKTETETKRSRLLVNLTSQFFFLASSFLGANLEHRSAISEKRVSTSIPHSFPQSRLSEAISCRATRTESQPASALDAARRGRLTGSATSRSRRGTALPSGPAGSARL